MSIPHAQKYRKRPVTIEAMQWDGTATGATAIIDWALEHDVSVIYWAPREWEMGIDAPYIQIETLEGYIIASPGDYVIKGVQGKFYPCKPDIFAKTYELMEDRS